MAKGPAKKTIRLWGVSDLPALWEVKERRLERVA